MSKSRVLHTIFFAISIIFCVIFAFILVCNIVFIIKGEINPNKPPAIFGVMPMVVCSGSMSGDAPDSIEVDDLIIVVKADMEKMKIGDIIAFYDDKTVVSHRIIDIRAAEDGKCVFYTKGDANNVAEETPVTVDNFIGKVGGRIPRVGAFILFLQRPLGLILFGFLPLSIILLLSFIFGKRKNKNK